MTRQFVLPAAALTTVAVTAALLAAPAAADPLPGTQPSTHPVSRTEPAGQHQARAALAAAHLPVVLVARVASGTNLRGVAARAEAGPGSVRHVLTPLRRVSVRVPAADAAAAADRLRALPGVTSVTRAGYRFVSAVPDDPDYSAHQESYLGAIDAPRAWARTHGSAAVKIAVVDSGVDVTHPDLAGKVVGAYNAHDGGSDVTDALGHGTFVAGVAAASTDNATGGAGAGYDSSILAVKVDQPDAGAQDGYVITTDDEAAGIEWAADHGADVINISLGSTGADATEQAAVEHAQSAGALVVAAAGNDAADQKNYPAAYPGVIAVGATDAAGHRAPFSNHGAWVTLAAPGTDIYSTTPTAGSTFWPSAGDPDPNYATDQGTSFSTPLVAGAAALLLAQRPTATSNELRSALIASAHGYAGTGLGAGQVDLDGALDNLAPTTTPGAPTVTGTSGTVTLAATSSAAKVRFTVDGALAGTANATDGNATLAVSSYGFSNGTHSVAAVDCSVAGVCSDQAATSSFDLANDAPVLTAPTDEQRVTGGFTLSATSTGGGIAFYVDDVKVGFDGSAPYSVRYSGSALSEGEHTVTAVQCSADGAACDGPTSDATTITSDSLHPVITSVSPSPFSPNGDKTKDTATVSYSLPDRESVSVSVRDSTGAVVRGPGTLGTFAKGSRTWVWNGLGNRGTRLGSGSYTVVLSTSAVVDGVTVRGEVQRAVTLDVVAPRLTSVTGNRATFYPVRDGYRDTFAPGVTTSEKVSLSLQIRDAKKRAIRTITVTRNAGRTSIAWAGTDSAGRRVAAGTYAFQFIAVDAAGNRHSSPSYRVTVSARKLVARSTVLTKNADAGKYYGPDCTDLYKSDYRHGLDIANFCDPSEFQIIAGFYRFALPAAVRYGRLSATVKGHTDYPPTEVAGVFSRFDRDDVDVSGVLTVRSGSTRSYSLGSVAAAGHLTAAHVAEFSFDVGNTYTGDYPSEFDLATVSLKVTYQVLG